MNKPKIEAGQVWLNRAGNKISVENRHACYEVFKFCAVGEGSERYTVTENGHFWEDGGVHKNDLVELIQDANEPQSKEGEMKDDLNEKKYSKQMIEDAHRFLFPRFDDWELTTDLVNAMEEQSEHEREYQEYLRLKEKFKNR